MESRASSSNAELKNLLENRVKVLAQAMRKVRKIAICAPPRHGKTTVVKLANERLNHGRLVIHCDGLLSGLPWSEQPNALMKQVEELDQWVMEGIQISRALRKGLQPDLLIVLAMPLAELTPKQNALGNSVHKWIREGMSVIKEAGHNMELVMIP